MFDNDSSGYNLTRYRLENTILITEYNPSVVGTDCLPITTCSTTRLPEAWTIYLSQNCVNEYCYTIYIYIITENINILKYNINNN